MIIAYLCFFVYNYFCIFYIYVIIFTYIFMYYTSEGCLYIMWSRRMKGASHGVCVLRKESPASGSSSRRRVQTSQARLNQLPAPNRHPLVATRSDSRSHKKTSHEGRKLAEGSGSSLVSSCKALTNRASVTRFLSFLSVVHTASKN